MDIVSHLRLVPFSIRSKATRHHLTQEELAEFRRNGIDAVSEKEESSLGEFDLEAEDQVILTCRSGVVGNVDVVVFDPVDGGLYVHHTVDVPFLPLSATATHYTPVSGKQAAHFIVSGFSTHSEVFLLNCLDQLSPDFLLSEPLVAGGEEGEEGWEEGLEEGFEGGLEGAWEEGWEEEYEDFEEYEEAEETGAGPGRGQGPGYGQGQGRGPGGLQGQRGPGNPGPSNRGPGGRQLAAPDGPQDSVTCADLDPRFPNLYACGSADGRVYFYDLSRLAVVAAFQAHRGGVSGLVLHDQRMATIGLHDKQVRFWDLRATSQAKQSSQNIQPAQSNDNDNDDNDNDNANTKKPTAHTLLHSNCESLAILACGNPKTDRNTSEKQNANNTSQSQDSSETLVYVGDEDGNIYVFTLDGKLLLERKITSGPLTAISARKITNLETGTAEIIIAAASINDSKVFLLSNTLETKQTIDGITAYSLLFINDIYLISGSKNGQLNAYNIQKRLYNTNNAHYSKNKYPDKHINLAGNTQDNQ